MVLVNIVFFLRDIFHFEKLAADKITFKMTNHTRGAWLVQSMEHATLHLMVVGLSLMLGVELLK